MQALYCNESRFTLLYNNYFEKLHHFLIKKCGCCEESADLAQEAFLKLWKNRDKVEEGKEASYLFTIANNLFIDKTRRAKVKRTYQSTITSIDEHQTPEYVMRMKQQEEKLHSNIQSMPEKSREVFIMNKLNDMTYAEIAGKLDLSVKAIEKRMSKALSVFRQVAVA